jgi:hypothetical protein
MKRNKPDLLPRQASRGRSLTGSGRLSDRDRRFARRLLATIRDPFEPLSKALCRAFNVSSTAALRRVLSCDGRTVLRIAEYSSIGLGRLLLLLGRRLFIAESGLPLSKATQRYARRMGRARVKVSRSSLYSLEGWFVRGGIDGLTPRWATGSRRRVPPAPADFVEILSSLIRAHARDCILRRSARQPDRPVSPRTRDHLVKELSEQIASQVCRRLGERRPPDGHRKRRAGKKDAR